MRLLYTALLTLLTPLIVARLWFKGFQLPAYRQRIGERFARVTAAPDGVAVWLHAVSVGESLAALPLIEALIKQHGERRIWVTTTTPTGSERVRAALGERVLHTYAPYDLPWIVARFLAAAAPRQVVVMETELWPNLFVALHKRGIPLTIANARLSPRSFAGYGRVAGFARRVLGCVSLVAAQSALDAERFTALGAPRVQAIGNLKFDIAPPAAPPALTTTLRAWSGDAPVWIAASTHEGEESLVLAAHRQLLAQNPRTRLILVPRHPQRFDSVAEQIGKAGLRLQRRSSLDAGASADAQVLLGDSMGEMWAYLMAADIAFVGGSFVPVGGHNVLEPAALALPVLFGPHMHNFLAARDLLLGCGAAEQLGDGSALGTAVLVLQKNAERRQRMGAAGAAAVAGNRGALQRLIAIVQAHG